MRDIVLKIIKDDFLKYFKEILYLLMSVYIATNGRYPAMEWLDPKEKPKVGDEEFEHDFEKKYGDFLKWRLTEEIDELILAYFGRKLVGCVGLNYSRLEEKEIPWIPKEFANQKYGFIELFVVHPKHQGKGIGKKLFSEATRRLRDLDKISCVVTFPNLDAIHFYESVGGVKIKEFDKYLIYCFEKAD